MAMLNQNQVLSAKGTPALKIKPAPKKIGTGFKLSDLSSNINGRKIETRNVSPFKAKPGAA